MRDRSFTSIETARLRLRRFAPRDVGAFHAYRADDSVARFQSWQDYTVEQAEAFVGEMEGADPGVPGEPFQFAVARLRDDALVGDCMLALAYSEACRGDASAAAELLGAARRYRFNATAHHVLHGVVVDPIVRAAIDADDYAESVARGKVRSADDVLHAYGIRTRVGSRPA